MAHTRSYIGAGVSRGPTGKTRYGDPGYQADGKPRYPIDSEEHVRAAWAYINVAENAAKYKPGQLHEVKAAIQKAMGRHGMNVYAEAGKKVLS